MTHKAKDIHIPVAAELMTRHVTAFDHNTPLDEAWATLTKLRITGAPVTDGKKVVGVISETELVHALAGAAFSDSRIGRVHEAMTPIGVTASPDTDVFALVDKMRKGGVRRLPICEDHELIGILTVKDVNRALVKLIEEHNRIVQQRRPAGAAWDPEQSAARDKR